MRPRTPGLLLVLLSLLLGAVGSLVAVASTSQPADACSIAGPHAEVWPSTALRPGQQIDIAGWGFVDLRIDQPQPAAVAPPDEGTVVPPPQCDFDTSPLHEVPVVWQGPTHNGQISETIAVVSGPDFNVTVTVPANAANGQATVIVGPATVAVRVGSVVEPPPPPHPCPLAIDDAATTSQSCPGPWPWPCPVYDAEPTATQPAPEGAPDIVPVCPEPCVDYAQTNPDGTDYDYRWDCPDPCGYEAIPADAVSQTAVWCPPPPDPCPVYLQGDTALDAEAIAGCPPPYPCPVHLAGDIPADAPALVWCPDPCGLVGGDAVWCPPVPCSADFDAPDACPLPMPAHRDAESALAATAAPTETALTTGPAARSEVAPTGAVSESASSTGDVAPAAQPPSISAGSAETSAISPVASQAVASLVRHIVAIAQGLFGNLF